MTKRRAEDSSLCGAPPKSRYGCSESAVGDAGVKPPSLLSASDGRSRKRAHGAEREPEPRGSFLRRKTGSGDPGGRASHRLTAAASPGGCPPREGPGERRRGDGAAARVEFPRVGVVNDKSTGNDCTYNSFQYWRAPLPALDLSLLEDVDPPCEGREKPKLKDSSSDVMET